MGLLRGSFQGLWRYGAAFGIIGLALLIAEGFYRVFDTTRLSMVFLAGILVSAVTLGANAGYFAAALAFVVYNIYLVEPRFTFEFGSAEDFLVLVVFLAVAVLTGGLAGRLRDEAQRNKLRAHAMGALFEASRELSSASDESAVRGRIVRHIAEAARGQAFLWDQDVIWSAPEETVVPSALLGDVLAASQTVQPTETLTITVGDWRARIMQADGTSLGVAAWRAGADAVAAENGSAPDYRLINVLVDLGAAAIMRARLSAARSEVEALARTEQLRNALLSSISHDLRTPLAAILASASSLKDFGEKFTPNVRNDLVTTIQEEAERLNRFVANLLSMTKLESGALDLDRQVFDAAEVLNRVVRRFERAGRLIGHDLGRVPLIITADPILLEQALGNILENAVRYSPHDALIMVRGAEVGGTVLIEVEDFGPGVPTDDLKRIFEKFYRSPGAGNTQGTGLGLSIARGLIEAMNGVVSARARPDGQPGLLVATQFALSADHGR
jgi:K+-sensing histidine kinase KdpD